MSIQEVRVKVRRVYSVAQYETVEFEFGIVDQVEAGGSAEDSAHALFGVAVQAIRQAAAETPVVADMLRGRQAAIAVMRKVNGVPIIEEGQ